MSEFYRLSWIQAQNNLATTQDIYALIDGVHTELAINVEIVDSEIDYIFPTDSVIEWWVRTNIRDELKNIHSFDSNHYTFISTT